MTTIGVLHPGAMGAAVGAAARGDVVWASEGRSAATAARAEAAGIHDVGSFARLVGVSAIVLSICPPAAALDVAERVARSRFDGLYVDANAVAPATVRRIAGLLPRCVDGGIIGGPPRTPGTTRFYVAGADAPAVAELFTGSALQAVVLPGGIGDASALKMAYAGWTKGSAALLLAVRALAEREGVGEQLAAEWALSIPELVDRVDRVAAEIGAKAWRFGPEMDEIAATMTAAGLPGGFHDAASQVYAALTDLQHEPSPGFADVVTRLLNRPGG